MPACLSWLVSGLCDYTVIGSTYHHFIVLYLISEFVSSPNGSSLPWCIHAGGTACFSGSACPPGLLSLEGLSVTLSSLRGCSSLESLVSMVMVERAVLGQLYRGGSAGKTSKVNAIGRVPQNA